jgi:membrane protease YdiL (CAAX protease family)
VKVQTVSLWRLLATVLLWVALLVAVVGATVLAFRTSGRAWAASHQPDVVAILLAEAYLTLLMALMLVFGGRRGLRDRLQFRWTSLGDAIVALVTWVAALIGGVILTGLLEPLLGQPQSNTTPLLRQSFDPLFVGLVVPTVCLLAPACEELLFRGALFGWLAGWLPMSAAIVLTAAVFAGAHLLPTLFPVLFVFGLAATWTRARTGSTFNSFVMHATQNTFAVTVTYLVLTHRLR